jgi:hypothetical protein
MTISLTAASLTAAGMIMKKPSPTVCRRAKPLFVAFSALMTKAGRAAMAEATEKIPKGNSLRISLYTCL